MIRTYLPLAGLLFVVSTAAQAQPGNTHPTVQQGGFDYVLSTSGKTRKPKYAYSNPYGVGPANDSR